jgi:hypothetical protein
MRRRKRKKNKKFRWPFHFENLDRQHTYIAGQKLTEVEIPGYRSSTEIQFGTSTAGWDRKDPVPNPTHTKARNYEILISPRYRKRERT